MEREVQQLSQELDDLKAQFLELRKTSRPFVHQSANNSPLRLKWSWADPLDAGAGPGSYNISSDLGHKSPLSHLSTSPRPIVPRARIGQPLSLLGSQSPPLNRYSPNSTAVLKADPIVSFSQADFSRLPYLAEMKVRSPGPVYLQQGQLPRGGRISISKRDTYASFVLNDNPSPQHYDPQRLGRRPNGRFAKSIRGHTIKEYFPGGERAFKGTGGVFNGNLTQPLPPCPTVMSSTGHQPLLLVHCLKTPTVGQYDFQSPTSKRGKFSFSKASKRCDVRKCTSYAVSTSQELRD